MISENDAFKDFIHQTREMENSLEDIPLTSRSDRRREKSSKKTVKTYFSTYAEFSCGDSEATYISGPSQVIPTKSHLVFHKAIDWNHLRLFYYVAQCRSFTKAARLLKVSQPLLSRTVKQLENRLQEKLFHRNRQTRQLSLTTTGNKILETIIPAVSQLESLIDYYEK